MRPDSVASRLGVDLPVVVGLLLDEVRVEEVHLFAEGFTFLRRTDDRVFGCLNKRHADSKSEYAE